MQKKQHTVTRDKHDTELIARGRHDPCVVPRGLLVLLSLNLPSFLSLLVRYTLALVVAIQDRLFPISGCHVLDYRFIIPLISYLKKLHLGQVINSWLMPLFIIFTYVLPSPIVT